MAKLGLGLHLDGEVFFSPFPARFMREPSFDGKRIPQRKDNPLVD